MSIMIVQGSILDFKGDAIVNPANNFLRHDGGLARVIAEAANRRDVSAQTGQERDESVERRHRWNRDNAAELVPTGGVHVTSAGNLPYKGIIHAVGPVWGGGGYMEADLLELAHENALTIAERHGWTSVAFPAISCGVFGYPVERAATIAVTVASWNEHIDVSFYLFEDAHVRAYQAAVKNLPYEGIID